MSYEQFLISNEPMDCGEPLSIDIHTWERDGERLIGELKDIQPFEGGKFDQGCMRYIFKTDTGLKSTILGQSIDKQLNPQTLIGRILCVYYGGKITLDDGRACNRFTVVDVTDAFQHWEKHEINNRKQIELNKNNLGSVESDASIREEIDTEETDDNRKKFFGGKKERKNNGS